MHTPINETVVVQICHTAIDMPRPSYEASTQCISWRFSPQRLHTLRDTLNAAAVAAIRSTFEADEVSYLAPRTTTPSLTHLARIVRQSILSRRSGGASPRQIVHYKDPPAMRPLPLPRGGRGYRDVLSQTLLSQKHRHGLASQEHHVLGLSTHSSVSHPHPG